MKQYREDRKPVIPTCNHLGKINKMSGFCHCKHPDKEPGMYLCVKESTCPRMIDSLRLEKMYNEYMDNMRLIHQCSTY